MSPSRKLKKIKVVVGTPVGIDSNGNYLINYPSRWTTTVKRSPFNFYPFEIAYLYALLKKNQQLHVKMVDAGLSGFSKERYLNHLLNEKPDWLILETCSRSFQEDSWVIRNLKKELQAKTVLVGQHPSVFPEEALKHGDFVCIGEFEETINEFFLTDNRCDILGLYPNNSRKLLDINSLPWPEDEDVSRFAYADPVLPGIRYKQIQFYASRGCPFSCNYCVCSNVYYKKPNWRPRIVNDIIQEMIYLKNKYPALEGFFFDEELHNGNKGFIQELCKAMIMAGLHKFHKTAMCAYYNMDSEMLKSMKEAGYYQLRIGIETGDPQVASSINLKGKYQPEKLYKVLENAQTLDLEMYGTFTIGTPGSDKEKDLKTLKLIKDLLKNQLLSEMQVSICTPLPGTPFYNDALSKGYFITKDWKDFDGSIGAVVSYPGYHKKTIDKLYKKIVFYGHHYRGKNQLKKYGLKSIFLRAYKRRGIRGILRHFFSFLRESL